MSGAAVGGCLIAFGATVFSYFTVWTFVLPFVDPINIVHTFFPPRVWLLILPFAGMLAVAVGAIAFVEYCSLSDKRSAKHSDPASSA